MWLLSLQKETKLSILKNFMESTYLRMYYYVVIKFTKRNKIMNSKDFKESTHLRM